MSCNPLLDIYLSLLNHGRYLGFSTLALLFPEFSIVNFSCPRKGAEVKALFSLLSYQFYPKQIKESISCFLLFLLLLLDFFFLIDLCCPLIHYNGLDYIISLVLCLQVLLSWLDQGLWLGNKLIFVSFNIPDPFWTQTSVGFRAHSHKAVWRLASCIQCLYPTPTFPWLQVK